MDPAPRLSHIEKVPSDMTYRILTAAALAVALAAPALAQSPTKYSSTTTCHSKLSQASGNWSDCTTEITVTPPPASSKPNCGYLPNFGINRPCPNMQ